MKNKEGRLIILATGTYITDVITKEGQEHKDWLMSPYPFNAQCTIIPDAEFYVNCRQSQSKQNRLFVYKAIQALKSGTDLILIAPSKDSQDIRLRENAIVFSLPERKEE